MNKADADAEKQAAIAAKLKQKADALAAKEAQRAAKMAQQKAAAQARIVRFREGHDWQHGEIISKRQYVTDQDYVLHQIEKLDRLRPTLEARWDSLVEQFVKRFELLELKPPLSVLCLGARLGHEVAAFISLGHFAIGNDLKPGEGNRYVVAGDFHKLSFADHSVDCVYINSVDHILDLAAFTAEIRRVLKPSGLFVADVVLGYEEGFWAGEFEALHWRRAADFAKHLAEIGSLRLENSRDLTDIGSPLWLQCVYRVR
jgi:SAM-dependent methyltransferase